jgi:hypothetical protein
MRVLFLIKFGNHFPANEKCNQKLKYRGFCWVFLFLLRMIPKQTFFLSKDATLLMAISREEFVPTEEKQIYMEGRWLKERSIPSIQFQRGTVGNFIATKYFLHGIEAGIKIDKTNMQNTVQENISEQSLGFYDFQESNTPGTITEKKANEYREKALSGIVSAIFEYFGFKMEREPRLFEKNPDLLAVRNEITCYIELKAFFGESPCFELEIGQAITYLAYAYCKAAGYNSYPFNDIEFPKVVEKLKDLGNLPSVFLFTSGFLIPPNKNIFLSGLNSDELEQKIQYRVDTLVNNLEKKSYSLDQIASIGRIKHWRKKFSNFQWFFSPSKRIHYISSVAEFKKVLSPENQNEITKGLLYLVNATIFAEMLIALSLKREHQLFYNLRTKTLEEIMIFPEKFEIQRDMSVNSEKNKEINLPDSMIDFLKDNPEIKMHITKTSTENGGELMRLLIEQNGKKIEIEAENLEEIKKTVSHFSNFFGINLVKWAISQEK